MWRMEMKMRLLFEVAALIRSAREKRKYSYMICRVRRNKADRDRNIRWVPKYGEVSAK